MHKTPSSDYSQHSILLRVRLFLHRGETEGEGYLYAISDHGDSAHFEWRYRRDSLDNIRCCPIVSKDGIVYYTSKTYDEPKFYLNCEVIFA